MKKILVYGPPVERVIQAAYGGGAGGYTRNMAAYLNFQFADYAIQPLFHTVRGELKFGRLSFLLRMFIDLKRIVGSFARNRPQGIHILAQYRTATIREYSLTFVALILGIPYLYDIKAGAFISFYEGASRINRWFLKQIITHARVVLCEGQCYVPFVKKNFDKASFYFPNFVPTTEVPERANSLFDQDLLRVVFVGYCVRDKGVFELLEGIVDFSNEHSVFVELTLIGSEGIEFKRFLETRECSEQVMVRRLGRLSHDEVLRNLRNKDIYCYPTSHKGEGHNNSVNEAMMFGLVLLTTRVGFLGEVLDERCAYFLDEVSSRAIADGLGEIVANKDAAKIKGEKARKALIANYTDTAVYKRLVGHYRKLTENAGAG